MQPTNNLKQNSLNLENTTLTNRISTTFPNSCIFFVSGLMNEEMLKISKEGFWVRGVKVEQGPEEAKEVYEAFMKLLRYNNA
jgi:hypothetical protein